MASFLRLVCFLLLPVALTTAIKPSMHNFPHRSRSVGLLTDLKQSLRGVSRRNAPLRKRCSIISTTPPLSPTNTTSSDTRRPGSAFTLRHDYSGDTFFDGWDFWNFGDPTHGTVQYVDQPTAEGNNLTSITSDGNAIMRVDTTPNVSGNRMSVRITTQASFTGGLVILDAVHMPVGCGTWPAFWSNGPNWPNNGEIDIVEGVHESTDNTASIHTRAGCTIPSDTGSSGDLTGPTDCSSANTGNQGCGERTTVPNSYGRGFNANGGGVYAMLWDNSGIAVFFFTRSAVPSDITSGSPRPGSWGTPVARWPATSCNPYEFFNDHVAIFDTTLCGDWAGNVWNAAGSAQNGASCAAATGFSTCAQFVQQMGQSFSEAYWEVRSVKIYST